MWKRSTDPVSIPVVLYTRRDCPLCDEGLEKLEALYTRVPKREREETQGNPQAGHPQSGRHQSGRPRSGRAQSGQPQSNRRGRRRRR